MTTPPPQGQNPFAQGQQPYGQPPQDQAPYGPPPQGYPQQPAQPGFPQQGPIPYAPVAPQRPKRGVKWYLRIVVVVCALIAAGVGYISSRHDPDTAKVGDCMSISNPDSSTDPGLKVVDCTSPKAKYKVAEKKSDDSGCDRTKYAEYTETGKDDFTLCLSEYSAK
ncbi:LppU/SCO3897 family protein [Streptomyces olivochromogenes]|uniref:LppU/SCO3897 family protein n=1 Tax=Streptomyces olivochromogenes TaxID=1963 RepID=UPI00367AABC3